MVFSSVTFLFYFLPIFLALYFLLPFKNLVLLVASILFYAWGELVYIFLMLFSIVTNFLFGLLIAKYPYTSRFKKVALITGVMINLLLLTYFKYFNFLLGMFTESSAFEPVHLPLGISFFTFQAISYLIDVYRGDADVEKNPLNLGLYISMFPQLIAGPIVRFKTVAQQIHSRVENLNQINMGIRVFIVGLAQKVLIANTVALTADNVFALPATELTSALAWLGSISYSLQIYFDFAGYSNMAIGLGLIMGFTFPQNFSHPYISQSITEFWRRWHMSLSQWFRDYLYIPLGGNRKSSGRTYINLFLVFLLCGLWHGAAWTFILWGVYQGLFLIMERLKLSEWLALSWRPLRHVYLLLVVIFGWVIFRADSIEHMLYFMQAMVGLNDTPISDPYYLNEYITTSILFAMLVGTILSMPVLHKIKEKFQLYTAADMKVKSRLTLFSLEAFYLISLLLSILFISSGSYNPFIYFRF